MHEYYALFALSVFSAAGAQLVLKLAAERRKPFFILIGYGLIASSTILNILCLRELPLTMMALHLPSTIVIVTCAATLILREAITPAQVWGAALVLSGSFIFGTAV